MTAPQPALRADDPWAAGIIGHLRSRGVIGDEKVRVQRLSGGVSSDVLAVTGPQTRVVVKQALHRLRVAQEWLADPARVASEAQALRFAARSQPAHVPAVLDLDCERHVLVIALAEPGAHEWRADLLPGVVSLKVAARLGTVLATWHRQPIRPDELGGGGRAFDELRVDPFYGAIARRHPDLSGAISDVVRRMTAARTCLVHGDFSPKNVLTGPSQLWVIDWEVAHYGDPTFDLAFMVTHLLCKSLHRPRTAPQYAAAAQAFLDAYRREAHGANLPQDDHYLAAQTACLLLARVDGKSPAAYLDGDARRRGREIARSVIASGGAAVLDDLWKEVR